MVTDKTAGSAPIGAFLQRVDAATVASENLYFDAQALSDALFGDHMPANLIMLGAAYQRGLIPLAESSITHAIDLNGSGAKNNLAAFRWGRAMAIDPEAVSATLRSRMPQPEPIAPIARSLVATAALPESLRDGLETRVSDLIGYQHSRCAALYLRRVSRVSSEEQRVLGPGRTEITDAFGRGMHKLMAYKDEYEVARLHLLESQRQQLTYEFGQQATGTILLHPPMNHPRYRAVSF